MTTDMRAVIVPKSDQISADDFIAGPRTYTIEGVAISPGTEQPVQIKLEGEPRAWRPCKSMSRVLVAGWGPDANAYIGRAVTLYRDPKVKWGGMEVGGIRVSHMSHIEREMLIQLTATKGKRAPHIVKPLVAEVHQHPKTEDGAAKWATQFIANVAKAPTADTLEGFITERKPKLDELETKRADLFAGCEAAIADARAKFEPEGKPAADQGEAFNDDGEWTE